MNNKLQIKIALQVLKLSILLKKRKKKLKKQRKRKYWIHPMLKLRDKIGFYKIFVPVLRKFPEKFKFCFKVTVDIFDHICDEVSPSLLRKSSRALPPDFKCYVYFK